MNETDRISSSRLPGFYELPIGERQRIAKLFASLSEKEASSISQFGAISAELTDVFIENAIGTFALPLGVATNFLINGKEILIPMAVEETSVLAAASHGAKLARSGGGFFTESCEQLMTGQVQIILREPHDFSKILGEYKTRLLQFANRGQEGLIKRGGGAKDLDWHYFSEHQMLVIHLYVDTCDAMGANIVNTMAERISMMMPELFPGCEIGLRILSNLCDRRISKAKCLIKKEALTTKEFDGSELVDRIVLAHLFAEVDPYRAATHNKGVMNGIDPVVIATGNDWRAIEAGAHSYCAKNGRYEPMTKWKKNSSGDLEGHIELPLAVGTVGGVTRLHPSAQAALKLLDQPTAQQLSEIICAVGLAQNLSALRALSSEGIQRGHMSLHRKNLDLLELRQGASRR